MDIVHTVFVDVIRNGAAAQIDTLAGNHSMWNWMMLGLESNRVIGLRIAKLMRGGKAAQREARRMVSEKVLAAAKAGTSLMAGASGDKIVEQYRRKVAANAKRLSRKQARRKRK